MDKIPFVKADLSIPDLHEIVTEEVRYCQLLLSEWLETFLKNRHGLDTAFFGVIGDDS